jgi:hypothetical protein
MSGPPACLVFCVFLLMLAGCEQEAEQRHRAEAERVSRAVTALRNAENAAKRSLLDVLARSACAVADVCEMKRVCVAAYRAHVEAFELSEGVRRTLDAADAANPAELVQALDSAETNLRAARSAARRCTDLEGEITRKYRL